MIVSAEIIFFEMRRIFAVTVFQQMKLNLFFETDEKQMTCFTKVQS